VVPPANPSPAREGSPGRVTALGERRRLVARAGVVGGGTLASRVLGLVRDMVLAATFDRESTDAWWVAFTIPNALRSLLGEGAVSSTVVPVLAERLERDGDGAARRLFARVRGASLLALTVVTVAGVVFARPLTDLFAGGYHERPREFERTVGLTRAVFPYILFIGTAALGTAALNVKRRFAVAAFAPGLLNVALIAAALALPRALASHGMDAVLALAAGALAGGLLQVAAQWPALRAIGYTGRPVLAFDDDVRAVLRRFAPIMLGTGIYYVDLVLSRRFLSGLGVGAQSYFSWAMRLCDFPQGVFAMALSTAALPSLSLLAARGDRVELATTWAHGMCLSLFVALPASALLVTLGEPLVATLFERGEFDAHAAHETARALLWQGGAVWTVAAVRQTVLAFYAIGDTRTPVLVSAIDLGAFVLLAMTLRGPLGHVGISVAVAGSSLVQVVLLLGGLKWRLPTLRAWPIVRSAARTSTASVVAAAAGWSAATLTTPLARAPAMTLATTDLGSGAGGTVLPGIAGTVAFGAVFLVCAWGLGSPELDEILGAARSRLGRQP
jgi:putative peptidoglycan lipid II flippase